MTILISVLTEAYSSRYKSAIQSTGFDRAVKRYRERARVTYPRRKYMVGPVLPPSPMDDKLDSSSRMRDSKLDCSSQVALLDSQKRVQDHLEELPYQILRHARTFQDHVHYFVGGPQGTKDEDLPAGLKKLMNDILGSQRLAEKIRSEILEDPDARNTLFTLSIEKALRKMVEVAEQALDVLEERDKLAALHEQQHGGDRDRPETIVVLSPLAKEHPESEGNINSPPRSTETSISRVNTGQVEFGGIRIG